MDPELEEKESALEYLKLNYKGDISERKLEKDLEIDKELANKYNKLIKDIMKGRYRKRIEKKEKIEYRKCQKIKEPPSEMKIIDLFYKIQYCPSFLFHGKVLNEEDYRFILNFYSDMYSISYDCTENIPKKLEDLVNRHILEVLDRCENVNSPEDLKKIVMEKAKY